jgi:Recombination endonuclease VII
MRKRKYADLTGRKFGRLVVTGEPLHIQNEPHCIRISWMTLCKCGNTRRVTGNRLQSGNIKSCGCWDHAIENLVVERDGVRYKTCTQCHEERLAERDFSSKKGKLRSICKPCENLKKRNKYHNNPEYKRKTNSSALKHRVGISLALKDWVFCLQGNKCACCGSNEPSHKNGWFVEHNRQTGFIRGVVCHSCNSTIGCAKESIPRLQAVIAYLKANNNLTFPPEVHQDAN